MIRREIGKRRVYAVVAILALGFSLISILAELDAIAAAVDDVVFLVAAAAGIAVLAAKSNRTSLPQLKTQSNILVGLFAVALLSKLFAILGERTDPGDLADELPALALGAAAVLNRVVW